MKQLKHHLARTIFAFLFLGLIASCQSKKNNEAVENTADTLKTNIKTERDAVKVEKDTVKKIEIDTVRGIDVSHFQGEVDWVEVKASGMHFGIAKATQGTGYKDPKFSVNWEKIKESGLYRGAYHFYVAKDDPTKQAENFVSTVNSSGSHHLPPVLDVEGADIGGLTVEKYQENVLVWLKYVEENLQHKPMIYTNHPFGNKYLDNKEFSGYHLWVAEYGSREAKIPESWKTKGWSGWQFTSHDTLKGVNGSVDESRFLSSLLIVNH